MRSHTISVGIEIFSPSMSGGLLPSVLSYVTQNGMSLKMEWHSKWNVTQNGVSLKIECHSKWNVIKNRISLKMGCQPI